MSTNRRTPSLAKNSPGAIRSHADTKSLIDLQFVRELVQTVSEKFAVNKFAIAKQAGFGAILRTRGSAKTQNDRTRVASFDARRRRERIRDCKAGSAFYFSPPSVSHAASLS